MHFISKAIIVSNGGKQNLHPQFYDWFPFMKNKKDRVILSDDFLQRFTFQKIMEKIHFNKMKKIVIIGGSASGFSAAWLLLNGPGLHESNIKFPTAKIKQLQNCSDCCKC